MHHCTALDNFAVGILHSVNLHRLCSGTEEVACINSIFELVVNLRLKHLRCCHSTHIADSIHIFEGYIATTHKVDEVACSLDILRVLRDYPTVKPYIATLIRDIVVESYANGCCLLDSPNSITAPSKVDVCLLFGHHLLTEVSLPARYKAFCLLEKCLYKGYRLV